jgi:IS30 family transposase
MSYHQITSGERYMISALRREGLSIGAVARQLGRHRSTIGRELRRNACRHGWYRPSVAVERTNGRRSRARRNRRFSRVDLARVEAMLARR